MNERIKQLWEEAAKTTQGDSWEEQTKFMEKFAELIVQECMACSTWVGKMNTNSCEPIHTAHAINQRIKRLFGVKDNSIKVGSRVKVVSGFNVGAKGTVSYIEPTGRMWVMRNGASTDVFYMPDEVMEIEE